MFMQNLIKLGVSDHELSWQQSDIAEKILPSLPRAIIKQIIAIWLWKRQVSTCHCVEHEDDNIYDRMIMTKSCKLRVEE